MRNEALDKFLDFVWISFREEVWNYGNFQPIWIRCYNRFKPSLRRKWAI